ncbi:MAG: hypothetical protein ACE5GQ_04925, partial [Nitrospinales bacterium]
AKLFGLCVKGEPPVPPMFPMGIHPEKVTAELRTDKVSEDKIRFRGSFWLDPGSDKLIIREIPAPTTLDPTAKATVIYEKITASFGGMFTETIPPNSLREVTPGIFVWNCPELELTSCGLLSEARVEYIKGDLHGTFEVGWSNLDLGPKETTLHDSDPLAVPNIPILFTLDIGNDKGGANLSFTLKQSGVNGKKWVAP